MRACCLLIVWFFLTACQPQRDLKLEAPPAEAHSVKVITPDWAVASTLTALDYPPIATGDTKSYREWVGTPALPSDIIDIGERFTPNFERLAQLTSSSNNIVIIDNDFYAHLRPAYGNTPHKSVSFMSKNAIATWQDYAEPTLQLGEIIHQPQRAQQFLTQSKKQLGKLGATFRQTHPHIKKIAVVQFADSNNLRIYTNNSLFRPTFEVMGLNLITLEDQMGKGNLWGFNSLVLSDLAKLDDDTCLVVVEPFSPMLRQELAKNLLWQRLGYGARANNSRCMAVLPPIWLYGGVSSMVVFGERLNQAHWLGGKAHG